MTFIEAMAGLQLIAEQDYGVPYRSAIDAENAREDESIARLRRDQG